MGTMRWCIDKADLNHSGKDRFEIKGWIWSKKSKKPEVQVYGNKNQEIPYKITWVKRPDVQKYLKLKEDETELGFSISINGYQGFGIPAHNWKCFFQIQ